MLNFIIIGSLLFIAAIVLLAAASRAANHNVEVSNREEKEYRNRLLDLEERRVAALEKSNEK